MEAKHNPMTFKHIRQHIADRRAVAKFKDRVFPAIPSVRPAKTTRASGFYDSPVKEDAVTMSSGAAGDPAKVTNPTDNYSLQKYRAQVKSKFLRRKTGAVK